MNIKCRMVVTATIIVLSLGMTNISYADGGGPVTIKEQTFIVYPVDPETLGIVQMMTVVNDGQNQSQNLKVFLPKGYSNLEMKRGLNKEKVKKTKQGLIDPTGMRPGKKKKVMVTYQMPMEKGRSQWTIQQPYVTKMINVVIQAGVLSFSASDLMPQSDLFKMNGKQFRRFTRLDLHPNTPWTLAFKRLEMYTQQGMPDASAGPKRGTHDGFTPDGKKILAHDHGGNYLIAAITLVIIVIALAFALIGLKRDGVRFGSKKRPHRQRSWLTTEKQSLLGEISQLETDYQSGLISQKTYDTTFEKLRNQFIRIKLELRKE